MVIEKMQTQAKQHMQVDKKDEDLSTYLSKVIKEKDELIRH